MITLLAVLNKIKDLVAKYWRQLLLVALGAILVLKAQGCAHKLFPPKTPVSGPTTPTSKPLPKDDKEIITVNDTNHTTTIQTDKDTTVVTGGRKTTVTVKKDGTVVVKEKTIGFCHNLMLGAAANNTGPKGTIGLEWFFYKKLDIISGIGADKYLNHTAGFTSVGYTPINKFFHGGTSFWVGGSIDLNATKSVIVGFSIRP